MFTLGLPFAFYMACSACWGVRGAIASYFGGAVAIAVGAFIYAASQDGLSDARQGWTVIAAALTFYVLYLSILAVAGLAAGLTIHWLRQRRLRY